jgi:hypothetical protein
MVNGTVYSLVDDKSPSANTGGCHGVGTYIPLPPNWMLAVTPDATPGALWSVAGDYYWSTPYLVNPGVQKGVYWTKYYEGNPSFPPGTLYSSGTNYLGSNPDLGMTDNISRPTTYIELKRTL